MTISPPITAHLGPGPVISGQEVRLQNSDTVPYSRLMCSKNPMAAKIFENNENICYVPHILTVQGVPLVGVEAGGDLGDGEEVILLHLPLQTRLLQQGTV